MEADNPLCVCERERERCWRVWQVEADNPLCVCVCEGERVWQVEADNRAIEEALALMEAEQTRVRGERRRMVEKVPARPPPGPPSRPPWPCTCSAPSSAARPRPSESRTTPCPSRRSPRLRCIAGSASILESVRVSPVRVIATVHATPTTGSARCAPVRGVYVRVRPLSVAHARRARAVQGQGEPLPRRREAGEARTRQKAERASPVKPLFSWTLHRLSIGFLFLTKRHDSRH